MLRIATPHVDSWNAWYADTGNRPDGVPALREKVDAACAAVGRDPAAIERTVAVQVRVRRGTGRFMGDTAPTQAVEPLAGSPAEIAAGLAAYAEVGIGQVQVVLDPIDRPAVEELAQALRALDG